MGLKSKWVVLWSLWAARLVRQPTAPVLVSNGWLVGTIAPSGSHNQYVGIPYATIPERFQSPGPPPVWEDVFDAVDENVRCRQPKRLGSNELRGKDNCLVLNVYTPLGATDLSPLPVMVFIHGGAFFEGSPTPYLYGPEYFINKGIILVTISYRLNIQGFICLRIKEAPGNAALKDQVAALKWIRRNIKAFGGDPDNVTIFGESAGAASASYHVLSPMSKGLFHKAILQSGSSLSPWAYYFKPVSIVSLLTKALGYKSTEDPHEIYKILSQKSNDELILTRIPREDGNLLMSEMLVALCVEDVIEGEEPFMTDIPYNILSRGKFNRVPMMLGANDEEGLFFVALENDTLLQKVKFEKALPKDLVFPSQEERMNIAEKVKKMYLDDEKISNSTKVKFSRFLGDGFINYAVLEESSLIAKSSDKPVFSYLFAYDGWRNFPKLVARNLKPSISGAVHADEIFYMFSQMIVPSMFEYDMIEKMTTMWTNFAKYGDPTPTVSKLLPVKWPQVDLKDPVALRIDSQMSLIPMWYRDSLKFWRDVYSKYRRKER